MPRWGVVGVFGVLGVLALGVPGPSLRTLRSSSSSCSWCALCFQSIDCQGATATQQPSVAASAIDGVWRACPTVQQILDAGGEPGEAQHNAGCYTMDFHGGVFREGGGAAAADTLAGRYSVDGTLVTINRNNGERFVFTWVLLGDTLSFGNGPAGSISPAPVRAVPFERIGD